MQRIILWTMFLIIVGTCVSISASNSYTDSHFLDQTSTTSSTTSSTSGSTDAPSLTEYVIVDGPGLGTVIKTSTDPTTGMVTADSKNNVVTNASGHIGGIGVGEGMNCPGPLGHFHGTIRGQADPDPANCGWGHVSEFNSLSSGLQQISNHINNEVFIIDLINRDPPAYSSARYVASDSIMDLSMLQDDVRDPSKTMIGPGKAKAVSDKLGKAIKDDKFVLMTLTPEPEKRDPVKDAAITLKINNALTAKQEAFMLLNDAEIMAAAMAAAMGE